MLESLVEVQIGFNHKVIRASKYNTVLDAMYYILDFLEISRKYIYSCAFSTSFLDPAPLDISSGF